MSVTYSFVVPVYNEEEIISDFYQELSRVAVELRETYEIIFSTGGNTDRTLNILRQFHQKDAAVKIINMSDRFDYQAALKAGLDHSRGKAVITLDGDLQHPPRLIPLLIEEWKKGFDIVYTIREDTKHENIFKRTGSKIFYFVLKILTKLNLEENAADFRLMSRKAVDALKQFPERKRYIPGIISLIGFNRTGIRYECPQRTKGRSKFAFMRMLSLALDGIFSFSNTPIRIVTFIGFIMTFFSFIYLIYVVLVSFQHPNVSPGWASILACILLFSSLQITILGLLGEYIGRIYEETKHRPIYIVDELIGFEQKCITSKIRG
jgi:Glycosyltransferases involved in cell wall biogenesis